MRNLVAGLIVALGLAASPAMAQRVVPPAETANCAFNTSPPTVTSGQMVMIQCDSNGRLILSPSASGTVVTGNVSNASSGVATTATNVPTVSYNYGSNGTTWDQLQVDGSKNLKVTEAAPNGKTTTEAKVTIAVTNTYQQALASSATRAGCTLQYISVAGSKGFVFFGASPADTTTSFQLVNGQSINCSIGGAGIATDAVQVTATATDIFVVTNQ